MAVEVTGQHQNVEGIPQGTYLERGGMIVLEAAGYVEKHDTEKGSYQIIQGYGKYGSGVKVFPSTAVFDREEEKPSLTWQFVIPEAGEYQVDLLVAPTNSPVSRQGVYLMVKNGSGEQRLAEINAPDFRAGESGDPRSPPPGNPVRLSPPDAAPRCRFSPSDTRPACSPGNWWEQPADPPDIPPPPVSQTARSGKASPPPGQIPPCWEILLRRCRICHIPG